jgi:type II secretory pathway component PulF
LDSGILLPQALILVGEQIEHPHLEELVFEMAMAVHKGIPLSRVLMKHPALFDQLALQMVAIGQEAGSLATCLTLLSDQMDAMRGVQRKVRAALFVPILTLLCFFGVASVVVGIVLPRFAHFYAGFHKALPPFTLLLLSSADFLYHWYIPLGFATLGIGYILWRLCTYEAGALFFDRVLMQLPFIGSVTRLSNALYLCRSLVLLLQGGCSLPSALAIARMSMTNRAACQSVSYLAHEVETGTALSDALAQTHDRLFDQDTLAIIKIGEDSSQLTCALNRVTVLLTERTLQRLNLLITIIQPLCIIILGLFITMLIFAVYMPMLQMGQFVM